MMQYFKIWYDGQCDTDLFMCVPYETFLHAVAMLMNLGLDIKKIEVYHEVL